MEDCVSHQSGPGRSTRDNTVSFNRIVYEGAGGISGIAADFDEARLLSTNNRFDRNRYEIPASGTKLRWIWGQLKDWPGLLASGQELNGAVLGSTAQQ